MNMVYKKIVLGCFVLITTYVFGQSTDAVEYLDINNLKIPLYSRGDMFRLKINDSEMPDGANATVTYRHNLWLGGVDQYNELRISAPQYELGKEMFIGPVSSSNYEHVFSPYNKVWKISRSEIEYHKSNYDSPSYTIPEYIQTWPAHGDVSKGEAFHLAPFVDINGNSIYEPELGEYPEIRGDQALFTICNDMAETHKGSYGRKIGVEVHVMLYAYNNFGMDYVENTYFVHYDIYNRSENLTYNDFYIGHNFQFALGYSYDDLVGTHIGRNMIYVYNGDSHDELAGVVFYGGYGTNPPAFGWVLLNQNLTSSIRQITIPDYPNGLSSSPQQYYLALQGLFNWGSPIYYGKGFIGFSNTQMPTKYMYSGDSDPNFTEPWYDNDPTIRNMTGSTQVHNFNPGDKICLDYAGVLSADYVPPLMQVKRLFEDVDIIQSVYDYQNYTCDNKALNQDELSNPDLKLWVDGNILHIQSSNDKLSETFTIYNSLGQSLGVYQVDSDLIQIPMNQWNSGVYFLKSGIKSYRFVKSE